jgi:8-amino-7-oxononanoate synthase
VGRAGVLGSTRPGVASLVDLLEQRAATTPDRRAYTFLREETADADTTTYGELGVRTRALAAVLQARTAHDDRVVVLLPPGLDFIAAFLACSYAGATAVPAFRPTPARLRRMVPRLARLAHDARAAAVVTATAVRDRLLAQDARELRQLEWVAVEDVPDGAEGAWREPAPEPDSLALLQYTSGSIADPKGVMVTHASLLANLAYLQTHLDLDEEIRGLLWVPPYHDLGLVGGILSPLYNGNHVALMEPSHFLRRPHAWLRALSDHRATHTACPNFALDLCVRGTTPEQRAELDLSSMRMLLVGGEPVQARTLERFTNAFAVAAFDSSALTPAYGLAEATLMVSATEIDRRPTFCVLDRRALANGEARKAAGENHGTRTLVGCGPTDAESDVRIVDPRTSASLPSRRVGEIWARGPSVARGYWNRPDLTEKTFSARLADDDHGPFLRTGDLGFLLDGELYVIGRIKDVIIVHGCNHYAQDIEQTAERADPALVPGGGAAFGVEVDGEERLVVVHELEYGGRQGDVEQVAAHIRKAVALEHEIPVYRLALIRTGLLPRTTNGKVRRALTARLLAAGALTTLLDQHARAPFLIAEDDTSSGSAVHDAMEWIAAQIRQLVSDELGEVDRDAPLSALGLDSVQVADLVQRIETKFGVALPLSDVPAEVTIAELAGYALGHHRHAADSTTKAAPAQRGVVFTELAEFRELRERLAVLAENPFFRVHDRVAGGTTSIGGRELANFASYNYLALSGDRAVSDAAKRAIDEFGTSVSASRLVSGERRLHDELERELAAFLGTEKAVALISGNLANVTTIGHLFGPRDLIVHDALAHDSIVQGALLSGAARRTFPHNDHGALERLLAAVRDRYERVLIAVEGVYSMDGDIADVPRYVALKDRYRAFLMVDEAHSFGVVGRTGRGVAEHFGLDPATVEVWMGTLSKALASAGGYIAGSAALVDYLKYSAPGFVFSVGLPPPSAGAALAAIRRLQDEPERVLRLQERSRLFLTLARSRGLDTGTSAGSPVIPVILGRSDAAIEASNRLLRRGINVQPIVHPAVEEGAARLRFFICSDHTEDQIETAVDAVAEVIGELRTAIRSDHAADDAPVVL